MALSLTFTGFVEEAKTFDWGSVVTVSHSNRKKNDAGQWETVSRDYIDISVEPNSDFAWLLRAEKGTRITATGNARISTYEKRDGGAGVRIKLWPTDVQAAETSRPNLSDAPF